MGKWQMFRFSAPYDCVDAQYVKMIFWQEVLRGTVASFVLYTFHSDSWGSLFTPKVIIQSLGRKVRAQLYHMGFNLGNKCLKRTLLRGEFT